MSEFFDRTLENLRGGPLGPAVRWAEAHPRLAAWIVLATGMVILLVIEARDVGLLPGQWVALIVATILVAGACIWIISFEDEEEEEEAPAEPLRARRNGKKAEALKAESPAPAAAPADGPEAPTSEAQK